MSTDLHLDPAELRSAAVSIARVLDDLRPLLTVPPDPPVALPVGSALLEQRLRLLESAKRIAVELEDLRDRLRHAAGAAEHADQELAADLRRLGAGR
jgi:hypothetical protein